MVASDLAMMWDTCVRENVRSAMEVCVSSEVVEEATEEEDEVRLEHDAGGGFVG